MFNGDMIKQGLQDRYDLVSEQAPDFQTRSQPCSRVQGIHGSRDAHAVDSDI